MTALLKKIAAEMPGRVEAALYREAQLIMTEAKRRCPVAKDGGILRASGQVHEPERVGRRIRVLMSFGGAADAYAIAVHETPSEHDPDSWKAMYEHSGEIHWTSEGTGPKFLEGPIKEAQPTINERVARRLNLNKSS